MLLSCPKCKVHYELDPAIISEEGKKLRCAKCGEVWVAFPKDLFEKPEKANINDDSSEDIVESPDKADIVENKMAVEETVAVSEDVTEDNTEQKNYELHAQSDTNEHNQKSDKSSEEQGDMQQIFARLSQQTEDIFAQEKNISAPQKFLQKISLRLGLHHKKNRWIFGITIILTMLLLLFNFRFEIVRFAPFLEKTYSVFGIISRIPGEGLEFQNVIRNEYEEDYVRKLEIRGFLANIINQTVEVPMLKVELLDKDAKTLDIIEQQAPLKRLGGGSRMAFKIVITKPELDTKYLYITVADKNTKK